MIGDSVDLSRANWRCVRRLYWILSSWSLPERRPGVVAIAGESGSGKTTLAFALRQEFSRRGVPSRVWQQDDYYRLPPRSNDRRRREDIRWIGPSEVRLELLDAHLAALRKGVTVIEKPLVIYPEDRITREWVSMAGIQMVFVEGTYVSLLQQVDCRIFIHRTYRDTYLDRMHRARDAQDAFLERVLEMEHRIVRAHKPWAHILITRDFRVRIYRQPV